jgi:hypothetical protein
MDNSYFTTISPYFAQQDQQGLSPVFQNIGQQQAMQNAALAQQNQQIQDAGAAFNQGGGMNPMAMAMALRGKKPNYDGWQTTGSNQYFGANSTGQGAGLSPDMLTTFGL